jgi:hypothetical protein
LSVDKTRDVKSAGSILRNLFGSYVPSDLLLLEVFKKDANKKYLGSLAASCFNLFLGK